MCSSGDIDLTLLMASSTSGQESAFSRDRLSLLLHAFSIECASSRPNFYFVMKKNS
jgi:hypothetical protein